VTRLLDRIAAKGWVKRERSKKDGRVVIARITAKGKQQLESLDGPLLEFHKAQFSHLSRAELAQLTELLAKARGP
jgi:DNA-binding MarR family transcriptional regulator